MMRWLNAGISALVTYVLAVLLHLSLWPSACVFLVVFVGLSLTGSSFGGIWNSGLWTMLPVRRLVGAVAEAAMFIATAAVSWWLVADVVNVPYLAARVMLWANRNGERVTLQTAAWAIPALTFCAGPYREHRLRRQVGNYRLSQLKGSLLATSAA